MVGESSRSSVRLKFSAMGSTNFGSTDPQQKLYSGKYPAAAVNCTFWGTTPLNGNGLGTVLAVDTSVYGLPRPGCAAPGELIVKGGIPRNWSWISSSDRL